MVSNILLWVPSNSQRHKFKHRRLQFKHIPTPHILPIPIYINIHILRP